MRASTRTDVVCVYFRSIRILSGFAYRNLDLYAANLKSPVGKFSLLCLSFFLICRYCVYKRAFMCS